MKIFLISYDLCKPEQDYESLITIINTFDNPIRIQKSVWLIESNHSSDYIFNALRNHIDRDDSLFICPLDFDGSISLKSNNIEVSEWLKEHLYRLHQGKSQY